jgi:hypothetical protein
MRFRLTTIAYVFALLAAGMAVFGGGLGIWAAVGVLGFWAWNSYATARPPAAVGCAVYAVLALMLLALLLPAVQSAREAAGRNSCMNNLKQIALGLMNHLDANGSLPAEASYDAEGAALHSWRTAALPFLEQRTLYSRLAQDQPWNSVRNSSLTAATQIDLYQCPSHYGSPSTAHYFAVVGQRTAWPKGRRRKDAELRDDAEFTLLLLEAPLRQAAWAEPVDFTFEEAVEYLSRKPDRTAGMHEVQHGFFYKPSWAINAAFLDGRVRTLHLPLPRKLAMALLTVDGGEEIDETALEETRAAELDYAKCYAFFAFMALALLPGVARLVRKAKCSVSSPVSY